MVYLPKRCFLHFQRANQANPHRSPLIDVIKRIKPREASREKGSERWNHCEACDVKKSFWWRTDKKHAY
jgi:hypothetical protein